MKLIWIALIIGLIGCGDDERRPPPIDIPDADNNTNNTLPDMDAGNNNVPDMPDDVDMDVIDSDMPEDMDVPDPCDACTDLQICIEGECVERHSCSASTHLGTLSLTNPITKSGSLLLEGVDSISTSCGGASASVERVFSFTLTEASVVAFDVDWTGQFDGVIDFRTDCLNGATSNLCSDLERGEIALEAGTHFFVMEVRLGSPGLYELSLSATPAECSPGERSCMGESLLICSPSSVAELYACGDTCANNACIGDSCAAPIVVTGTGGTYSGDGFAYDSNFTFTGNASCGNVAMPGYELVFSLPGLQAGQIVTVNAATGDANSNGIFIMSTCEATPTCLAYYLSNEDIDWVVPAAGNYTVVIDKLINSSSMFNYSVTVSP